MPGKLGGILAPMPTRLEDSDQHHELDRTEAGATGHQDLLHLISPAATKNGVVAELDEGLYDAGLAFRLTA